MAGEWITRQMRAGKGRDHTSSGPALHGAAGRYFWALTAFAGRMPPLFQVAGGRDDRG